MNPEPGAPDSPVPAPPPTPWAHGHFQDSPEGRLDVPLERVGKSNRRVAGGGGLVGLGYLLLKLGAGLKFIIPALAKAPFLISIFLNIGIYALFFGATMGPVFGIAFGAGFVGLIFVHEMGHLIAARYEGVKATVPFFIPFMGAAIFLQQNPKDARSEAVIGIGGPITGTLGALAMYGSAVAVGPHNGVGSLFARLAYYGFLINLFNMIPFTPLDGGRILGAVSKWFNVVGLGLLVLGIVSGYIASPFLIIILIFGALGTYRRFTRPEHAGYYDIPMQQKAIIGLSYLGLLAILVWGMVQTEVFITDVSF